MRYNHFDMLPERAFLKVGGRITLEGGGGSGGGGSTQQTSTAYQTNIPAYLEDPAKRMVARGETLSEQAYEPYKGTRVAGFTPGQTAAFTELGGMTTPGQFGEAGAAVTGAERFGTAGALGAMGYTPEMFNAEAAKAYMSPYQQAVTDIAKREATTEAAGLNRELAAKAAKAGAFGGSRFGIEQALLGSKLATNLADIQTKGSQEAFLNAQQQFERDRAARLAGAKFGLEGAQFGADVGLKSAAQLGQLGTAEQEAALKRISAQQAAGAQQQALEQQKLDTAYQQAMEQRDWEKNQLGFLSGLIRGTPFSTSQLQTQSAPGATTASQLASIGLGAYGLSSLLGKKEGGAIKGYADGGSVEGYAYGGDISAYTDKQLQDAAMGKSDIIPAEDAKQELARRAKLRTAVQGKRAEDELATRAALSEGIAGLEADNMEFADGGIVGYAEGGDVAHFDAGGNTTYGYPLPKGYDPTIYEMFEDPTSGEVYPRKRLAGAAAYGANLRAAAQGKPSPVPVEKPAPTAADTTKKPDAASAAPAQTTRVTPGSSAAASVANKLATQQDDYADIKKLLQANQERTAAANAALADEFAKAQENVAGIRGDVKGIAALRAAAAIAQGGPGGTLGQIGRGLGVAGEEAARGVNQIQAAQQGLMGQRLQLASLERAAASGDLTAALQLRELQQKGPLYAAQAGFYNRDRGMGGGQSLAAARLELNSLDKDIKNYSGQAQTPQVKQKLIDLQRRKEQLLAGISGSSAYGLGAAPKGAIQYEAP